VREITQMVRATTQMVRETTQMVRETIKMVRDTAQMVRETTQSSKLKQFLARRRTRRRHICRFFKLPVFKLAVLYDTP
jgi:vacuolar-type H+-ATPase subunit E/Vma4